MLELLRHNLLFHEICHGLIALPFALLIFGKTRSKKYFLTVILLTFLLDIDHLIDYFAFFGLHFNLSHFLVGKQFSFTHRAYVVFHAWEWLLVLAILFRKKGWMSIWAVLFMAILPHLVLDTINVGNILFYSIIYRMLGGFAFIN